jgi:rhamnulokinase
MKDFNCIAVDMGAASIRIMTGSIKNNKISYNEISRFKNEIKLIDGHERWDVENIIKEINNAISVIISDKDSEISSIGVDSWGVDFVLLDKSGELLEQPVAYRDSRTQKMQEKWESVMSREETFRKTGINFYQFNTLFQLLAIKDEEIIRKVSNILFMPCYISYRLSGRIFNELSIASTSQLLNVDNMMMNTEILDKLNLRPEHFGKILMPGSIAGNVTKGHKLPECVKMVAVCCHDTASAVAAVPSSGNNFAFISTGTWCLAGMVSDKPALDKFALQNGFTNERGFNNCYRVLKNIVGLWLIQGLQNSFNNRYTYGEIEELVIKSKSQSIIIPDNEIFYNPADMKSAFDQFLNQTGQVLPETPGDYFKIAYNSLCCSFRDNMDKFEIMLNTRIDAIHLIGGGGQSQYLCRQTANISGKKVIAGPVEGATIGNILVQAIALKVISSIEEGREIVRNSFEIKEYTPRPDDETDKIYERYRKINKN